MVSKKRFEFTERSNSLGETIMVPQLSFNLSFQDNAISVSGLLDTGASVNVLPYEIGLELGLNWDNCMTSVMLAGNLAKSPAKGVILSAEVAQFTSVPLVFAWTQARNTPVLLGRTNFFQEFDVCFYTSQLIFEIALKSPLN
jgi:hypothetical protein